ncbi:MAG: hypothetical protein CFH34_00535 [Alphaproteobacteria bacterium MarineAlpha9_Bin4]|nr:MAG: hypothetical protein CFH34_00535 [Alphaproteobacteria bacterium MarineAlpha9_Bin4]
MIEVSKKGTVPVLVLNNKVLDESMEIIIWALEYNDKLNLLNPYIKKKKETLDLISKIDNKFKYHLDRYKYSSRYEKDNHFKGKYIHRNLAESYLLEIENTLYTKKNTYLFENRISILDISIFPLVRQFRTADLEWFKSNPKLTAVNRWLDKITNLDFFNIIMKKYKPWKKINSPELFSSNLKI